MPFLAIQRTQTSASRRRGALLAFWACAVSAFLAHSHAVADPDPAPAPSPATYPWRHHIVTTYFWIGQGCTSISDTTNKASAWDADWTKNFGGVDNPATHKGFVPTKFAATLNPFYVALPFNDVVYPELAKKYCPWYHTPKVGERYVSQCKGHWIEIRSANGKVAYAQWQDVGPIRTDHASYVFGNDRPHDFNGAGLDVSPAVRDYLGLSGLDITDWRFVDASEVPSGPWLTYGEQAVVLALLKEREKQFAQDWRAAH